MKAQVIHLRKSPKGYPIAYVQCGQLVGECWASPDVKAPGEYELKSTLAVVDGRLTVRLRVEKQ